ncbi:MAG TPA: DUF5666 domain-containing protein [Thermoanaerobaculia bacterium]|jgi:hypothetical protein
MRKMTAFALVSCLSLGATALVAQTTPSTSMDKPATTTAAKATKTTTTTTTKKATHAKVAVTHGAITAIDAAAKTITIKDTYATSDTTKISDKGAAIKFEDLKVGDNVYVSYTKNGDKNDASKITVSHPKAAKK